MLPPPMNRPSDASAHQNGEAAVLDINDDVEIGGPNTVRKLKFLPDCIPEMKTRSELNSEISQWRRHSNKLEQPLPLSPNDLNAHPGALTLDLGETITRKRDSNVSTIPPQNVMEVEGATAPILAHVSDPEIPHRSSSIASSPPRELFTRARFASRMGRIPYRLPLAMTEPSQFSRELAARRRRQDQQDAPLSAEDLNFISVDEWGRMGMQVPVQEWELLRTKTKSQRQQEELDRCFKENITNIAKVVQDDQYDLACYDTRRLALFTTVYQLDYDADPDFQEFCKSAKFLPGREHLSHVPETPSDLVEYARLPRQEPILPVIKPFRSPQKRRGILPSGHGNEGYSPGIRRDAILALPKLVPKHRNQFDISPTSMKQKSVMPEPKRQGAAKDHQEESQRPLQTEKRALNMHFDNGTSKPSVDNNKKSPPPPAKADKVAKAQAPPARFDPYQYKTRRPAF